MSGLRLGADDYVVKPFSPAELVARVDAVLRRIDAGAERRAAAALRTGLVIDARGRRVLARRRGGAAHPTRVRAPAAPGAQPRPGLLTQPADGSPSGSYSFYTDTSTVTVHIRRLRGKIEADPGSAPPHRDGVGRGLPLRSREPTPPATGAARRSTRTEPVALRSLAVGGRGGHARLADGVHARPARRARSVRRGRAGLAARASRAWAGPLRRQLLAAARASAQLVAAARVRAAHVRLAARRAAGRRGRVYAGSVGARAAQLLPAAC